LSFEELGGLPSVAPSGGASSQSARTITAGLLLRASSSAFFVLALLQLLERDLAPSSFLAALATADGASSLLKSTQSTCSSWSARCAALSLLRSCFEVAPPKQLGGTDCSSRRRSLSANSAALRSRFSRRCAEVGLCLTAFGFAAAFGFALGAVSTTFPRRDCETRAEANEEKEPRRPAATAWPTSAEGV
jgi:hypothetical protein